MSSPTTFLMKSGSDGIWVPPAQMILISSVFGSIMLMSCEMKGECFRVKSEKMMAGLQHFPLSRGFAPIGVARASRKASSTGFVGRGVGVMERTCSGEGGLLSADWSGSEGGGGVDEGWVAVRGACV